jgi:multidrug efflux pump subunit AcrB
MSHVTDAELIRTKRNTARYFAETRHVAWVLLVATAAWGIYGYLRMPKAKDPTIAVRVALATASWPGATAEKVEQLVTRPMEQKIAENATVDKVESLSRSGVAIITITLKEDAAEVGKEFDDIKLKLDQVRLPDGAGPIQFIKDFGDTAALMLTVASPKVDEIEIELRAQAVAKAMEKSRGSRTGRAALVLNFPASIDARPLRLSADEMMVVLQSEGLGSDARLIEGPGFLGVDLTTDVEDTVLLARARRFGQDRISVAELHPDTWQPVVIREPAQTQARLAAVRGDKYSYRELDDFTDRIQRYVQSLSIVSKVSRTGVLSEEIHLEYSQERASQLGLGPNAFADAIGARNIILPGGVIQAQGKNFVVDPSGELRDESEIGGIAAGFSAAGLPLYMRDVVDVSRGYQSPARFLNYLTARGADGQFERSRAVTLSVQMRPGAQIGEFGRLIDGRLATVKQLVPHDLILRRTSDQPLQVEENVSLFMSSLYEAIILVVLVALVGFWEWRSALLLALSIPITLAMTFGMMHALGIDLQQVSIASLIIALGLLVDDPVVANDAIKRARTEGFSAVVSAWLGPTRLATAILFATITNIASYLPFLALPGDVGRFIYTLPVVLTCSLVASRVVSMSFIPLLAIYLVKPDRQPAPAHGASETAFARQYRRVVGWAIDHRHVAFGCAVALLVLGGIASSGLKTAFFPKDLSYLSYVDVWLPEDAPLSATQEKALEADAIVREVADELAREQKKPRQILESVTTFVGGGGPRFWPSVTPEQQQLNYAQLVIQVKDKHDTNHLVGPLQAALTSRIAGARIDVRQLENGKPVGVPVAVRISGEDALELRSLGEEVKQILRSSPLAERVRDDWGAESFSVKLQVDPDRANLSGVTNLDVAHSSAAAISGTTVSTLRDGDRSIPIIARLRSRERAQLSDIAGLYVTPSQGGAPVTIQQVSNVNYRLETEKIRRRNQFRTLTVSAFPSEGSLPSEVLGAIRPQLDRFAAKLPPGYEMAIGGEYEDQVKGFRDLATVLGISVFAIFLALVLQFKNAVKPLVVFAAIPFGAVGALVSLAIMKAPFGFMAFLGIISLIGVIVSHIIVLFDFIEEAHERGEPLRDALLDAGLHRLRPVLITVGATVLGLFPLAAHGGPLWEPLCYAQIGGLAIATFLTLLLVPVIYTIVVRDLKWIRWERPPAVQAGT